MPALEAQVRAEARHDVDTTLTRMASRFGFRVQKSRQAALAVVLTAVVLSGCASPAPSIPATSAPSPSAPSGTASGSPAPSTAPTVVSAPVGLAVIGHSGATGYDSDPRQPGTDIRANSWATGVNPEVQSIYLRLLAEDPTVQDHATNLALAGSDVTSLIAQAGDLVSRDPPPKLVLIQTIDNDMQCDGTDETNLASYDTKLTQVLDTLTQGVPGIEVLIVSVWADVKTYDRVIFALNPAHLTGTGPCDTVDPATGRIDPSREASLQALIDAYFAVVTDVCGRYPACRTDGGAMRDMDLTAADVTADFNHLSVAGQAKMAAIAWGVLAGG